MRFRKFICFLLGEKEEQICNMPKEQIPKVLAICIGVCRNVTRVGEVRMEWPSAYCLRFQVLQMLEIYDLKMNSEDYGSSSRGQCPPC